MGIKLIKKTNETADRIDFSEVEADAKKFDFAGLMVRLGAFRTWFAKLQKVVPVETPRVHWASKGSSGCSYSIDTYDGDVILDFRAATNPEDEAFIGGIYVGGRSIRVRSIDELTDALIGKIAAIVEEGK